MGRSLPFCPRQAIQPLPPGSSPVCGLDLKGLSQCLFQGHFSTYWGDYVGRSASLPHPRTPGLKGRARVWLGAPSSPQGLGPAGDSKPSLDKCDVGSSLTGRCEMHSRATVPAHWQGGSPGREAPGGSGVQAGVGSGQGGRCSMARRVTTRALRLPAYLSQLRQGKDPPPTPET